MNNIKTNPKNLGKSFEKLKTLTREPKHMGYGIYVHNQFRANNLVKRDTFFDADWGPMVWDGQQWTEEKTTMRVRGGRAGNIQSKA